MMFLKGAREEEGVTADYFTCPLLCPMHKAITNIHRLIFLKFIENQKAPSISL